MVLPGGISVAGELRRDFRFRPVNGELELMLSDSGEGVESLAAQVTRVLHLALERIGGMAPTADLVPTPLFLLSRLA